MVKRKRVTTTPEPVLLKNLFAPRDVKGEERVLFEFLAMGIDDEDISYLNMSYRNLSRMICKYVNPYLFNILKIKCSRFLSFIYYSGLVVKRHSLGGL